MPSPPGSLRGLRQTLCRTCGFAPTVVCATRGLAATWAASPQALGRTRWQAPGSTSVVGRARVGEGRSAGARRTSEFMLITRRTCPGVGRDELDVSFVTLACLHPAERGRGHDQRSPKRVGPGRPGVGRKRRSHGCCRARGRRKNEGHGVERRACRAPPSRSGEIVSCWPSWAAFADWHRWSAGQQSGSNDRRGDERDRCGH